MGAPGSLDKLPLFQKILGPGSKHHVKIDRARQNKRRLDRLYGRLQRYYYYSMRLRTAPRPGCPPQEVMLELEINPTGDPDRPLNVDMLTAVPMTGGEYASILLLHGQDPNRPLQVSIRVGPYKYNRYSTTARCPPHQPDVTAPAPKWSWPSLPRMPAPGLCMQTCSSIHQNLMENMPAFSYCPLMTLKHPWRPKSRQALTGSTDTTAAGPVHPNSTKPARTLDPINI